MLFKLESMVSNLFTHTGVLEFTAEEGRVYLPEWMMEQLKMEGGEIVKLKNVELATGKFLKIEPQSVAFLDISDPKAVLEKALRNYSCLTENDIIFIEYNNQIYRLKCLETKPTPSISIHETDLEVDFAPPVGYVEPTKESMNSISVDEHKVGMKQEWKAFTGDGARLSGRPLSKQSALDRYDSGAISSKVEEAKVIEILKLPANKLWFGYKWEPIGDTANSAETTTGYSLKK